MIAEWSGGIPRIINNMCFCAMSYAWAMKRKSVDRDAMCEVMAELDPGATAERVEKEVLARKMPDEPKISVSTPAVPVGFRAKSRPVPRWFSKFLASCLLLSAFGLFGLQPNIMKWISSSCDSVASAVRSALVPNYAPATSRFGIRLRQNFPVIHNFCN